MNLLLLLALYFRLVGLLCCSGEGGTFRLSILVLLVLVLVSHCVFLQYYRRFSLTILLFLLLWLRIGLLCVRYGIRGRLLTMTVMRLVCFTRS